MTKSKPEVQGSKPLKPERQHHETKEFRSRG
jgi:hypothetical protein